MEQKLKERLVGAIILIAIAVIFIPSILGNPVHENLLVNSNNSKKIPAHFTSRITPILESQEQFLARPNSVNNVKKMVIEPEKATQLEKEKKQEYPYSQPDIFATKGVSSSGRYIEKGKELSIKENKVAIEDGASLPSWTVQLGSFSSKENAYSLNEKLKKSGLSGFVDPVTRNGKTSYRVRVGPETEQSDAKLLLQDIKDKLDIEGIIVYH